LESGHPEKALTSCRRALDQDACLEEAHCLAMRIYAIMDDRSAIARQYQACKSNLQTELGLPPSRETEELYHRLTI
jgi:DNA-binding SARP family transcriptional activator